MNQYLYLLLNVCSVAYPALMLGDKRIHIHKNVTPFIAAISGTAFFFIVWDIVFTMMGIWHFNPKYITGFYLINLPIEEVLFFLCIPIACMFIYEVVGYFIKKELPLPVLRGIAIAIIAATLLIGLANLPRLYTSVTMFLAAFMVIIHISMLGYSVFSRFIFSYLIHLIPFGIVNGILTAVPVVIYNNDHNTGIRLGTIPAEDSMYSLIILLMNVTIYEYLKRNTRTV